MKFKVGNIVIVKKFIEDDEPISEYPDIIKLMKKKIPLTISGVRKGDSCPYKCEGIIEGKKYSEFFQEEELQIYKIKNWKAYFSKE